MNVASLWFLLFVGLVAVVYHLCPTAPARRVLLSVVNFGFLVPLVPNWSSWALFGFLLVTTYLLVRLVAKHPARWMMVGALALVVAGFAVLKKYTFLEPVLPEPIWQHSLELVGISYMLFKFIHVFVDQAQGQLDEFDFATYVNYQLAFFTLIAGPIQRFNDFRRFWREMGTTPVDTRQALLTWNRILTGLLKMGPICAVAAYLLSEADDRFDPRYTNYPILWLAIYTYSFFAFLYFNFSGYTDIVIGAARLLGLELPENFNRPFLARNVVEFWNRWHISLTHWFRDYVFMASFKAAAERFPAAGKYLGWGLIFLALFLAGVWHGSTSAFAIYGALNGAGAAINQVWGELLKKTLGRAGFQRYQRSKWIEYIAILLTFNFECFCLLFFSAGTERALLILRDVADGPYFYLSGGAAQYGRYLMLLVPAAVAAAAGVALIYWQRAAAARILHAAGERLTGHAGLLYAFVLVKAALVTVLLMVCWAIAEREPVVVYMRF